MKVYDTSFGHVLAMQHAIQEMLLVMFEEFQLVKELNCPVWYNKIPDNFDVLCEKLIPVTEFILLSKGHNDEMWKSSIFNYSSGFFTELCIKSTHTI